MRVNLDHIHLIASDLGTTIDFFTSLFGARVEWDEPGGGACNVRLALDGAFIHLYDQPPRGPRGGAMHHIGVNTDDLEGVMARMQRMGVTVRHPVREDPRFRYAMIARPDELLIEVFECKDSERWECAGEVMLKP